MVTGIETKFLSPAHSGDTVTVDTEVGEIKRVTAIFNQRIRRGDTVLATQTVHAAFTNTAGRPTRAPDGFTEALAPYQGTELG